VIDIAIRRRQTEVRNGQALHVLFAGGAHEVQLELEGLAGPHVADDLADAFGLDLPGVGRLSTWMSRVAGSICVHRFSPIAAPDAT